MASSQLKPLFCLPHQKTLDEIVLPRITCQTISHLNSNHYAAHQKSPTI
jgi:hypothetical protein